MHALFGAFLAGVVMPRDEEAERVFSEFVEPTAVTYLLPIFFAFSGLRTSVNLITGPELWGQTALILAVAIGGKGVGSALSARVMGATWADASLLGVLMNTRGLVELVVLNIGFDLGILSPVLFSMMVVMALTTTLATSPLVSRLKGRASMAAERVHVIEWTGGLRVQRSLRSLLAVVDCAASSAPCGGRGLSLRRARW